MKSMTGYGKAKYSANDIELEVEIKTINGRYLDMKIISPRELSFFDHSLRRKITHSLHRGTVEIRVTFSDHREPSVRLDTTKLRKYHEVVKSAQNYLGLDEPLPLQFLLSEPGVIEIGNSLDEDPLLIEALETTVGRAIDAIIASTAEEGAQIKAVIMDSLARMKQALDEIEKEIAPFKQELLEKLRNRITELLSNVNLDNLEQRLVQETAIYVDKYDIQEEISRLRSHITTFERTIAKDDEPEIGKTLSFITQEMHREANTLGSKFSTTKTFAHVLILKEEVEKCREICLNVT
ncbi:MAG TPA: DUF1732 domain-containing protein [Candidatus Cloacimonadota bacterium]|nr:DUF1732 domain-containing protein [Candidatus Cloacimonadota bacterium]